MSQFWDDRYGSDSYAYGREPNDFLRAEAHRIPKGKVLCLAEGEGRNAVYLAGLGYDVTMVDFSAQGLAKAKRLADERGVPLTVVQGDLATWEPEEGAWSGVVAIFMHLRPEVRARVFGWIPRALRPGGVFVLEAYTPRQLAFGTGGPPDAKLLVEPEDAKRELAPLAIDVVRETERDVQEGTLHSGRSATVQIVARRA